MNNPSHNISRRGFHLKAAVLGLSAAGLVGCGRTEQEPQPTPPVAGPAPARAMPRIRSSTEVSQSSTPTASTAQGQELVALYNQVSKQMYGFVAGNPDSPLLVHVVFDPQCPHCGNLWVQSQQLSKQIKFFWMPVAMLRPVESGMTNGALIMASPDPVETMNVHEHKLLNKLDPLNPVPELVAKGRPQMEHNVAIAQQFRLDSVPLIMHQRQNGEIVSTVGGIGAPELVALIGA